MNAKQAIALLVVVFVAVLAANLVALKIAATQVESSVSGNTAVGLLGSLFGRK